MATYKKWSEEDLSILTALFPTTSNSDLADILDRHPETVRKKAYSLGVHKDSSLFKSVMPKTHDKFMQEIAPKLGEGIKLITKYINSKTNIQAMCSNGHEFTIVISSINSKSSITCKVCAGKSTYIHWGDATKLNRLKELFYSDMEYESIAKELGTSLSSIQHIISKEGLVRNKFLPVLKEVVDICIDLDYEITNLDFITNAHQHIQYICNNGHTASTLLYNFKNRGDRCSECMKHTHTSKGEQELLAFIRSNYSDSIIESDRSILNGRELDIVLPDIGLAFEFNGIYYHSEKHVSKEYHLNKTEGVLEFGYSLIHVNEDEWLNKQNIVKSRISGLLGNNNRIFARNCTIRLLNFGDIKEFLNTNHLQGAGAPSSINYGLFVKEELVAVMTFSSPRFSTDYTYELVRYCSKLYTNVIGGASKLLKAFTSNHTGSIVSYSDRRWGTGNLYSALGFSYSHASPPNYRYYKNTNSLSRYQCQKHKLKSLFPELYSEELTEAEIMSNAGYYKVYDSGNCVWVL